MTFAIALVTTVVGFALVWIALPNKTGENPRWMP